MTTGQYFSIIAAVYVARGLPRWLALIFGIACTFLAARAGGMFG